jgi:hypothetical protein
MDDGAKPEPSASLGLAQGAASRSNLSLAPVRPRVWARPLLRSTRTRRVMVREHRVCKRDCI